MTKKILFVDDELDMRIHLRTLLETSGYTPIPARNGKEGLKKARDQHPDLIILDVMMPEAGGVLMYRELKGDPELKHIPVIMLSGVGEKSFAHSLKVFNITIKEPIPEPDAYFEKPLEHRKLLDVIGRLVGQDKPASG